MITAVVPVSPIPSHPDTAILEETVGTIRHHLPDAEIILTFDGVRPEQDHYHAAYAEHIYRVLWKAKKWGAVAPFVFEAHAHQVGMMRRVIDEIRTPLLLYVEQDTPLVCDEPIDWELITKFIMSGESNLVRLHHEGVIPKAHEHMMHGEDGSFIRTSQWSQRPHIATVPLYRHVLSQFSDDANCFIEDKMHSVLSQAWLRDGMIGWNLWRAHVYNPGRGNVKRSYHIDGRAGDPKFDEKQRF